MHVVAESLHTSVRRVAGAVGAEDPEAALGPEPVNIDLANCPLVASQQRGGGGTVGLSMREAVEQSRALQKDFKVLVFTSTYLCLLHNASFCFKIPALGPPDVKVQ